jgi:hypothetical protein
VAVVAAGLPVYALVHRKRVEPPALPAIQSEI